MCPPVIEKNVLPLASVVISNYNYARFVGDAIDSALAQTYKPLEVIVVDDGSTDDSRDVIASYGNRITAVLKENGGMGSAVNAGFERASGDVILFLDSDDMLLPDTVEKAADILRDRSVAKVQWRMWRLSEPEGSVTGIVPHGRLASGDLREKLIEYGPHAAVGTPASGNAWSAAFLRRVLPMPENELRQNSDSYLNTLVGLHGVIREIGEPQGYYRVHGANDYASSPKTEQLRRNLKMYDYRCRLLSEHLAASGTHVDPGHWKHGNVHYERLVGRLKILQDMEALVREGESYILLDSGRLGDGTLIPGRRRITFGESNASSDDGFDSDQAAIAELENLRRAERPALMVIIESALSWLERHKDFAEHLRARFLCRSHTDRAIIFDLRESLAFTHSRTAQAT
jgi:glycosyltransferase involved in cell wall biosynthesis